MKHLFFFYWLLSLITGITSLSYLFTIMVREKSLKPLPYTLLVSNFTLLIIVNILASYHYTNIDSSIESVRVYLIVISVLLSFTIFTAPHFLLTLYGVADCWKWSGAFLVYAAAGAVCHAVFFMAPWLMIFDASIPVLFLVLSLLLRKREPLIPDMKPFLRKMKVVLLIYIPFYLLLDLNFLNDLDLLTIYSGEHLQYFGILPLFYGIWNIMYLYYEVRYGLFSTYIVRAVEDNSGFLEFCNRFGLSKRETEILEYVLDGVSRKEIAEKLYIAEGTVKKHVQNIFEKTGCHSRLELMALIFGRITGYTDLPPGGGEEFRLR